MLIQPHHQMPPEIGKKSPTSTQHQPQVATSFDEDETPCLLRERMPYHHLIAEKKGMNQTIEKRVPMSAQQRSVSQAAPVAHLRLMVISMMSTRQKNHAAETIDK